MITPSLVTGRAWPPNPGPMTEIQPFTYEDGITFADLLYDIKNYIQRELVPYINTFPALVDAAIAQMILDVTAALEAQDEKTDVKLAELKAWVEAQVNAIINNSIELQDEVLAGILLDDGSDSRDVADSLYATKATQATVETGRLSDNTMRTEFIPSTTGVYNMDNYPGANDSAKLQAAIDAATAADQERTILINRPITLTQMVTVDIGVVSLDFRGTVNTAAITSGPAFHFTNRYSVQQAAARGAANNRKSVRGLRMHGPGTTMANVVAGTDAILFRSESGFGSVRGVTFYDCEFRGYGRIHVFETNAYLIRFINTHLYYYNIGAYLPSEAVNAGESMTYIACCFGTGGTAIQCENSNADFYVADGTSFDFVQAIAKAVAGKIGIYQSHMELNSSVSPLVSGPVITTGTGNGEVTLSGGKLMFHSIPNLEYLFSTANASWGGGIFLIGGLTLYNAQSSSGFLCGGTGRITTENVYGYDGNGTGSGGGSICTSVQNNLLIDGYFSQATVIDPAMTHSGATSPTASPGLTLAIDANTLRVTKLVTGGNSAVFAVDIPVSKIGRKEYAGAFTLNSGVTGQMFVGESYVALGDKDARGIRTVLRSDARSSSSVDLVSGGGQVSRVFSSTQWDRTVRPWATHFRLTFTMNSLPVGAVVFSMLHVSAR